MKPGRIYGAIAFYNIIASSLFTYIIYLITLFNNVSIDFTIIAKILTLNFSVFSIVWAAVFGSSAIAKVKENKELK